MTRKDTDALLAELTDEIPIQHDPEFLRRLAANFGDIATLYRRLYGARPDWKESLHDLVRMLAGAYRARPVQLKELDRTRERNPRWYLDHSIVSTMVYVDRFAGDLRGMERKIPYFHELGVNLIHIMPILDYPDERNDGGYAVRDYRAVRAEFGTTEDLSEFARLLHDEGMYLELDFVVNHCSDEHEWAVRARRGEKRYQDYFFMYEDRVIPDAFERSLPEVFPETAPGNFTWVPEIGRWVMTVFHEYQWDLNFSNPDVLSEMLDTMFFLVSLGVDVVRMDAVPYLWKRIGTTSQNLEEAHRVMQLFHACARVVAPGVVFVAEAIVQPHEIVRYFGENEYAGRECEVAYNASLMVLLWDAIATGGTRLLRRGLEAIPDVPDGVTWLTYLRCHDDIGLGYDDNDIRAVGFDPTAHRAFIVEYFTGHYPGSDACGAPFMYNPKTRDARISGTAASLAGLETAIASRDPERIGLAIDRVIMLYSLVFSIGGIPIVYYGDEIATLNDYSYTEKRATRSDNRWMHRPTIDWATAALRSIEGTVENRVFTAISRLIAVRKTRPEFAGSMRVVETFDEHVLGFVRDADRSRILVLANVSPQPRTIDSSVIRFSGIGPDVRDIAFTRPVSSHEGTMSLPPYGFYWMCGV